MVNYEFCLRIYLITNYELAITNVAYAINNDEL